METFIIFVSYDLLSLTTLTSQYVLGMPVFMIFLFLRVYEKFTAKYHT